MIFGAPQMEDAQIFTYGENSVQFLRDEHLFDEVIDNICR